jgi:hypothetical protein
MFVNNTIVCASVDQCNTCDTPIFRQNGPHDGGVIFPLKTDKNMYLYLVSCDCAGLCIKCSFCPCQCFCYILWKLRFTRVSDPPSAWDICIYSLQCFMLFYGILTLVFTVYIGIYMKIHSFTPPRGTALFFLLVSPLLKLLLCLVNLQRFFEAFQKNRGIYLQIIPFIDGLYTHL